MISKPDIFCSGVRMEDKEVRARYDAFVAGMTPKEKKSMAEKVYYYMGARKSKHSFDINDARRIVMGEKDVGTKRGRPRKPAVEAVPDSNTLPLLLPAMAKKDFDAKKFLDTYMGAKRAQKALIGELKDVDRTLRDYEMYSDEAFFPSMDELNEAMEQRAKEEMMYGLEPFLPMSQSMVEVEVPQLESREPYSFETASKKPMNLMIRLADGRTVSAGELHEMRKPRPPPGPPPIRPPRVSKPRPPPGPPPEEGISIEEFLRANPGFFD